MLPLYSFSENNVIPTKITIANIQNQSFKHFENRNT
jgi:hypothetical protein